MQGLVSDKTFHLKWNNHLQNLSQLFTAIYSSSALADVTLSCRDGTLKAHKLVLSACSPYFEQIFKDNPCQHPIVILKGIPFSEINLLVEFMYKGSVDVQELDLQSLMHTASELEIRGLAYEPRDNAAQLLNVNLEYPAYNQNATTATVTTAQPYNPARTDVERLKQKEEHSTKTGVRVMTVCFGRTDTSLLAASKLASYHDDLNPALRAVIESVPNQQSESPESAARGVLEVCRRGASGSVWLAQADQPVRDVTATVQQAYKLMQDLLE